MIFNKLIATWMMALVAIPAVYITGIHMQPFPFLGTVAILMEACLIAVVGVYIWDR